LALLLDPDKIDLKKRHLLLNYLEEISPDIVLIGGSLMLSNSLDKLVELIKLETSFKTVLFPGNTLHLSHLADSILFLSLISGRNPDLLIGQHVHAAPVLKKSNLEVIPTGYMLIDGGKTTTANYISNTLPIPAQKPEIAACTALAGQMLGLKCIYLDGGSGAARPVPQEMIKMVRNELEIPLIVGGGIRTAHNAEIAYNAGADMLVIGTQFEKDPSEVIEISKLREQFSKTIN
jgi:putative glycerol-1-phosphate prenyltransferase